MRTLPIAAALLGTALVASPAAFAGPIAAGSEFNVFGPASFSATTITFTRLASSDGNTGSFAGFGSCLGCVTMTTPLTYNPFTPGQIYTAMNNGLTATFTITSNLITKIDNNFLTIEDAGTATLTGFDTTPGIWRFSAQNGAVTGSFSATTLVNPDPPPIAEPAALGLLALGATLIGVASVRRRRAGAA